LPNGEGEELNPETLSSELLGKLSQRVNDEVFKSVTITVPALFETTQIEATKRAAKNAGFEQVEILMEPVAASFSYASSHPGESGKWVIFDFGGGTFDSSLVEVDEGVMKVVSSEGDNRLGGKDLDNTLVSELIMPVIIEKHSIDNLDDVKKTELLNKLKLSADKIKIELSFNETVDFESEMNQFVDDDKGVEIELDRTFTRDEANKAYELHFQKAIDLTKTLISRNNLTVAEIDKLILVGGPTQIPFFRKMIEEQIMRPEIDLNPMTAVAEGAAIYSGNINSVVDTHGNSTIFNEDESEIELFDIEVGFESSTVDDISPVAISRKDKSKDASAILTRLDGWISPKVLLDDVIELSIIEGVNNFKIDLFDSDNNPLRSNVSEINITKGFSGGETSTQMHFGIGVRNIIKKRVVFTALKGLEIDTPLPAVGLTKPNGELYTPCDLRPGLSEDRMIVEVYQAKAASADIRVALMRYTGLDFSLSGEEVPSLIKQGSVVYITMNVSRSQEFTMEFEFPESGVIIEKKILMEDVPAQKSPTIEDVETLFKEANNALEEVSASSQQSAVISELIKERDLIRKSIDEGLKGDAIDQALNNIKDYFIKVDNELDNLEWPKLEDEIRQSLNTLEDLVSKCREHNLKGHEQDQKDFEALKSKFEQVRISKNQQLGQSLLDDVNSRDYRIRDRHAGKENAISYIRSLNNSFGTLDWKDSSQARIEIDKGMALINSGAGESELKQQLGRIINLMQDPNWGDGDGTLRQ
jgi:molecular chaperone DnaK